MTYNQENYRVIIEHQQEQYERKFFKILQNSSDEELLPCPFCGYKAPVHETSNHHDIIRCSLCGLFVGDAFSDKVVAKWNRRVKE